MQENYTCILENPSWKTVKYFIKRVIFFFNGTILNVFVFFQLSGPGAAAPNPTTSQGEEPVGYLNMGFSAPPPSSPLSSRGVEDMSHQRPTCHNPSMRREQDRLDSFHPWTLSIITPAELAKAGFYYLGQGDRVACFSCGGQVCIVKGKWTQLLPGIKWPASLASTCIVTCISTSGAML